jgi:nitroreductase
MHIPDAISERRSIRAFTDREITDEKAKLLVEAACMAPSAGNLQPWEFVVVRDPRIKRKLVNAAHGQTFIFTAPVVFVVCVISKRSALRYGKRGRELYCLQDTAAAIQNLLLTAKANGLGSCWIGAFDERRAGEALDLPKDVRPIAIVPVGYPAECPSMRPRRPIGQVLHKERW